MIICNCSLAGTYACRMCHNNYHGFVYEQKWETVDKIKTFPHQKITKRYDKDGNLIEKIIEDMI